MSNKKRCLIVHSHIYDFPKHFNESYNYNIMCHKLYDSAKVIAQNMTISECNKTCTEAPGLSQPIIPHDKESIDSVNSYALIHHVS